jgi:glycerol dehydrogenase-like iron-containing ADH family enzyme
MVIDQASKALDEDPGRGARDDVEVDGAQARDGIGGGLEHDVARQAAEPPRVPMSTS